VTPDVSRAPRSSPIRGGRASRLLQRVLLALWVGVVPALLALLVLRFLVPPAGTGLTGRVAELGERVPVLFGVALFFLFSAIARHWRFHIPGGRYASPLPAHLVPGERDGERLAEWASRAALYEVAASPATRRALEQGPEPGKVADFDQSVHELHDALVVGDESHAAAAARAIESTARGPLDARKRRELALTLGAAAVAAAAAFGIRARIAESYVVLSASMLPTLEPGDRLLGNKLAYAGSDALPRRGDVLAFESSAVALPLSVDAPAVLVKRVMGLPGDHITMMGGQPVINGWPVPYCDAGEYVFLQAAAKGGALHGRLRVEFVDDRAYLTVNALATPFRDSYDVKPGEVFVLGDNRGNSLDSRAWNGGHGGGVPLAAVDARAQRFLVASQRSGDADWRRFGSAVDRLGGRLRLEGVNAAPLDDAVASCLAHRPVDTHPPPPAEAVGPRASREPE